MPDIELRLIANNEEYIKGIKESQTAYQQFNNSVETGNKDQVEFLQGVIEGMLQEIETIKKAEKQVGKTGESFRTQLRKMREELSLMEKAGKRGTEEFNTLLNKASDLESQIGDTSQKIKALASDTKNLDAIMSVGEGLAGGFAIAQGAAALFGASQESIEKQLLKVQSALGLLNGIQAISNTLNKDSAARVVIAANAQRIYALAVGQSTGAMKIFRTALLATGIGALVIGLGLLIANWDKITKSISRYLSTNAKLEDQIEKQIALNEELLIISNKRISNIDRELTLLEAQGDKEDEIYRLKRERAKIQLQDQLRLIDISRKQLQLSSEEVSSRVAVNTAAKAQFGAIGAFFTSIFYSADGAIEKSKGLSTELEKQNQMYKDLETEIKAMDITETNRIKKAKEDTIKKALDKEKEAAKQLADAIKQLNDRWEDAKISSLTGIDRINAEEQFQLQEVANLRKHLESLNALTAEQKAKLTDIENAINLDADQKRDAFNKSELDKELQKNDKLRELHRKIAEDELELIGASEQQKLELKKKFYEQDIIRLEKQGDAESLLLATNLRQQVAIIDKELNRVDKKKFSIWGLLGIDAESDEGKKAIESLKESTAIVLDQVAQMMDAELAQAEQHTQLLEKQLDEAKNALDKERDLQEQGLANNVDAKQREITQLKIEREKALAEEKKIQKEKLLLDSATQASSLITATANIIESFSALPIIGQILSVAAIALMWGTFAASKVKANQAINAKLEKGGSGVIKGKRHSQGGERFLNYEAEDGEAWGVLNRSASQKYKSFFPDMVNSMNSLQFPNMKNQTIVNVDTKKMQSKLEDINTGIKLMNENMLNQSGAFYVGKTRVEKLSRNHTRIIHAAD